MSEAVVVGVRVRPYNDRERALKATLCIDMQGPSTVITGPNGIPQTFSFDQSFWSHDDFIELEGGYCAPKPGGRYADQRLVFDTFGQRVLDNAWAGYHCCLFAYGQTGAGKSYSMVGYGVNKGIVPISCEEIFNRVDANKDTKKTYEIQVSMVEIYNETVQDLFIPFDQRPKNGFQIRESKALGIYVDGIVKNAVNSYAAIEKAIDQGTANRSIGSTQMNATSSRAHTVITIEFKQVDKYGGTENVKVSNINLIDLAGSEKAAQTGATGDRLKEGSAINKSLSALGNVIEKLAERSQGKGKKDALIPYRDSKLTRLLQNALGGSSKTIMICALSPASSNYEETLSTLRYADRAKKIKNSAVINENPQEKLMRELREENAKLKSMVGEGDSTDAAGGIVVSAEATREQKEKISQLEEAMSELQKSYDEKLEDARKRHEDYETRQTLRTGNVGMGKPMMVNLNAEMQLTGKLRFEFPDGKGVIIGGVLSSVKDNSDGSTTSSDSDSQKESSESESDGSEDEVDRPKIQLSSPGVHAKHARIDNFNRRCILACFGDAGNATWINGVCFNDLLEQKRHARADGISHNELDGAFGDCEEDFDLPDDAVQLRHCDRLVFGRAIFLFVDPSQGIAEMLIMGGIVSYAKARKELPPSWKRAVTEGNKDANRFQVMIRDAVTRGIAQAEADQAAADENGTEGSVVRSSSSRGRGWPSMAFLTTGPLAKRSSVASLRSAPSGGGETKDDGGDSSGESSYGDGATKDEVMILQLKDEIAARDREIEELRRGRDQALLELKHSRQEVTRLRQQLVEVTASTGTFGLAPSSAQSKAPLSKTRFNEKVAALDRSFKDALAVLDSTRLGLTTAASTYNIAEKLDMSRMMSVNSLVPVQGADSQF